MIRCMFLYLLEILLHVRQMLVDYLRRFTYLVPIFLFFDILVIFNINKFSK